MSEQPAQKPKQEKEIDVSVYGMQGNEGQYGQGQYDSEGDPDPHGKQAQEIFPDEKQKQATFPRDSADKKPYKSHSQDVPLD